MSFAKLFSRKEEQKSTFAHMLRSKLSTSEQEIQPIFASLLRKEATLSFTELHPKYQAGTPGGKGGQFMPKGSADYNHAIKDAKIHAKNLADHIKNGGKDNDDTAKAWSGKIAEHVANAHEKGVNPEHMAEELTDAGLTQWNKKKLNLPMTGKEKEFTDKAMAAAMKLYNKNMAAKKSKEHKDLLIKADAAKVTHGVNSKEYKVLMSKANKAAAKAMEYGKEPAVVAQAPQEVVQEHNEEKENKKKALYNAALTSAKNAHLGIKDTAHDDKHVAAYAAAKNHFSDDELQDIQQKAVADNNAKVAQGIANIAGAKSYHAKYQQFKNHPYGSAEHNSYKRSSAEYKHHYNEGAVEHGLTALDKAEGVGQGFALHNAGKHGVQVIAPTGVPIVNHVELHAESAPHEAVAPEPAKVPDLPQAAMTEAEKNSAYLKSLDTPSKIKNAIYSTSHALQELDHPDSSGNFISSSTPKYQEAFSKHNAVLAHADKNNISSLEKQALIDQGIEHSDAGKFKLPFKAKSKNKLPLAAQSVTSQAESGTPHVPVEAQGLNHPTTPSVDQNDPHGLAALDTPSKMKNAVYDAAHKYHSAVKAGLPSDEHNSKLVAVSNHAVSKLGALDALEMRAKAKQDVNEGKFKLPFKAKSKNKLPLAAQSTASQTAEAPVAAPVVTHAEHPILGLYKTLTDPHDMAVAAYSAAHDFYTADANQAKNPNSNVLNGAKTAALEKMVAAQTIFTPHLGSAGVQKHFNKAADDHHAKKYDPPKKVDAQAVPAPAATHEGFAYHYADHPLKDHPNLTSATDTKEIADLKKDAFDKAAILAKAVHTSAGGIGSPEDNASKEASQKLFEKTDYNTALDIQDAGGHHFNKTLPIIGSHNSTPSNPYEGHPLAKHDHLVSSTNTPEMAKMKKDVYDATYHLMGVLAKKDSPSSTITAAANEVGKVAETLNANISPETTVKALHISEQAATDFKANNPAVAAPVAAPIAAPIAAPVTSPITFATTATLATSMAATPKANKLKPEKTYTPLPTGTDTDPHGITQLKTKQQAENALYAASHNLFAAQKAGDNDKAVEANKAVQAYATHFKSFINGGWTPQYKQANAVGHKAKIDFAAGKVNIPNQLAKHLFETSDANAPFAIKGGKTKKPGDQTAISSIPLGTAEDKYGLSQLDSKQKVANALYALAHAKASYVKGGGSSYDARATKIKDQIVAVSTHGKNLGMSYNARQKLQTQGYDDVYYHNKFELPHPQPAHLLYAPTAEATANATANVTPATPATPVQAASSSTPQSTPQPTPQPTPVSSLTHLPTTKPEAEDLNKTLAKNYYTLRHIHGGNKNHPEVEAAYAEWDKLKDHMKSNMGYQGSYFSSSNMGYQQEVNAVFKKIEDEKAAQKKSAVEGYTNVSNDYHALALSKGPNHIETMSAKAGVEKAAIIAKQYLSDHEIQAIDSAARQGAEAHLIKQKTEATKEVFNAVHATHLAEYNNGKNSTEHLAALNNANNIMAKHKSTGILTNTDDIKNEAGAKAKETIKAFEKNKAALANAQEFVKTYDNNSANYKYLSGQAKDDLIKLGDTHFNGMTPKQASAMSDYTMTAYKAMNKSLINGAASPAAKQLTDALDNSLGQDLNLRRNMPQKWFLASFGFATANSSREEMKNLDIDKLQSIVGQIYHEPSFSSASYDGDNTTMASTQGSQTGGMILRIRADKDIAKGMVVDKHSSCPHEREVLLQQGAVYVIRAIRKVTGSSSFHYEVDADLVTHKIVN